MRKQTILSLIIITIFSTLILSISLININYILAEKTSFSFITDTPTGNVYDINVPTELNKDLELLDSENISYIAWIVN